MINIKTLVYFDLEATGMKSAGRPRMSKIVLVAVNLEDVEKQHMKIQNQLRNKNSQDYLFQIECLLPNVVIQLREAFQSKNQRNLGISPNGGGASKNQKSPKFQLGIVQN